MEITRRTFLIGTASTAAVAAVGVSVPPILRQLSTMKVSEAPTGWLHCNGARVLKSEFPKLAEVLGETYGGDDEGFHVPDLRASVKHHEAVSDRWGHSTGQSRVVEVPTPPALVTVDYRIAAVDTDLIPAGIIMPFAFRG